MYRRKNKSSDDERRSSRGLDTSPSRFSRRSRQYDPSPSRGSRSRTYDPSPSRNTRSRRYEPSPSRSSRSQKYEPSPNRSSRSRTYEPSPSRSSRSRTYEPSPSRDGHLDIEEKEILRRFEVSPLRISFRSKREKESPARESTSTRESRRFRRVESSPLRDDNKPRVRSLYFDESPARDTVTSSIRSRNVYTSLPRELIWSRREDPSPDRENIRIEYTKFSRSSPSPVRSRNRQNELDSNMYLGRNLYGSDRSLDRTPPSPRLGVRAVNYSRLPLRELPTTPKASRSYRISCTSRDDESDLDYLTKVREILLGEPMKGKTQHPAQILPHMYIGSQANAESLRLLRKIGITHVLNCAGYKGPRKNPDANPYEGLGIDYYEFKADDRDGYDISQHFDEAFRYLESVKRNGGICLVHCALGINRSGATVVAYLMIHSKWPLLKAVEFVKKKRGIVLSNHGFQRQLIRFARQQSLLEPLPERLTVRNESPATEQRFVKSLNLAKYGHWSEALDGLKYQPKEKYEVAYEEEPPQRHEEPLPAELGTELGSALMYRYARFMNRDKV